MLRGSETSRRRKSVRGILPHVNPLAVVVLVPVAGWLIVNIAHPYIVAAHLQHEKQVLQAKYDKAKQQNQDLRKQVAAQNTPQGKERLARQQGYVKPGEVPMLIPMKD